MRPATARAGTWTGSAAGVGDAGVGGGAVRIRLLRLPTGSTVAPWPGAELGGVRQITGVASTSALPLTSATAPLPDSGHECQRPRKRTRACVVTCPTCLLSPFLFPIWLPTIAHASCLRTCDEPVIRLAIVADSHEEKRTCRSVDHARTRGREGGRRRSSRPDASSVLPLSACTPSPLRPFVSSRMESDHQCPVARVCRDSHGGWSDRRVFRPGLRCRLSVVRRGPFPAH
jgi:hypothetical protein